MSRAQKYIVGVKKSGFSLSVTTFTQSLGAELLTNGNFAAWTGDNPDGWTVTGEVAADPEVSEVAANEGHGGAGTGAANLFSSATTSQPRMNQSVMSAAAWYEFAVDITNYVAGGIRITDGSNSGVTYAAVGTFKRLWTAVAADAYILGIGAAPHDITVDNASVKQIVQNAQRDAVPSGVFSFKFTLPSPTFAGQIVALRYRISTSANFIIAYLLRNAANSAWDIRLDSYAASSPTNLRVVTGVGDPDTIRVTVIGDTHQLATGVAGVFTDRGAVVSNSLYNTVVGVNTIYSPGTTPLELRVVA